MLDTTDLLKISAAALLLYMSLAFALAYKRKRLDTVDAAWGVGFVMVSWLVALSEASSVSLLVAILVTIWGLRLTNHIWRRSIKHTKDDRRYTELSSKWNGNYWRRAYLSIFLLQGLLIWIISLPIILAANTRLDGLSWLVWLGALVWIAGFAIEATADYQLKQYLANKDRPTVLQVGLWHYSRHPNYFGEITQWCGIAIIACQASYGWIGLISPITLTTLIVFVSGIPPIERRRQEDRQYREYQQRTSPLIPWPPRQ